MHQILQVCLLLCLCYITPTDSSQHPLFYIYSWSESITNSFPDAYTHRRQHITEEFARNYGVGPLVDAAQGLYHTHQYSLFSTVLARLEESPYRTLDPAQASLFFIPYDVGMDATARKRDGALLKTGCPRSLEVIPLLHNSPYFAKYDGADHFLLHSINQPMLFFMPERCRQIYELCLKCTKLCIDTYNPQLFRELRVYPEMSTNWVSVPFPSNHHYSHTSQAVLEAPVAESDHTRWYDLVYVGTDHVSAKHNKLLRGILRRQCMRATDPVFFANSNSSGGQAEVEYGAKAKSSACWLGTLGSHASETPHLFAARQKKEDPKISEANTEGTGAAAEKGKGSKTAGTSPYCHGRLCLMPGGDFPTRKAVLDAILCGCVPVTFQRVTAQEQWPWHWVAKSGKSMADAATIYVNREEFIQHPTEQFASLLLLARNASFLAKKRLALQEIRSQMQYRLPHGYPAGDTTAKRDAVDVILDNLFSTLPVPI
jgi:hypothetical protein